jgi:two-component system, OmpR family, response regulator
MRRAARRPKFRDVSTVLVVDRDPRLASVVSRGLAADGHSTAVTLEADEGLRLALSRRFGLIVLELPKPGLTGTTVLERTMAERPEQAVIVLSGLTDVETKVRCFALGAVDYLTKPFALGELRARVKARTSTVNGNGHPNGNGHANGHGAVSNLRAGGIRLDLERRVADAGYGPRTLSNREFLLLRHLMSREGEVCSREALLAEVWGLGFDPGTNVVDVYVSRLRSKLGRPAIETVRNVGYALPA